MFPEKSAATNINIRTIAPATKKNLFRKGSREIKEFTSKKVVVLYPARFPEERAGFVLL